MDTNLIELLQHVRCGALDDRGNCVKCKAIRAILNRWVEQGESVSELISNIKTKSSSRDE